MPPEIRVTTLRDDVSYLLPVRPLGRLRWVGLFLVVFGVIFLSGPFHAAFGAVRNFASKSARLGDYVAVLFEIPFFVAGLVPLGLGLLAMFGRCRVEWRDRRLSVVEFVGPLWWRRRLSQGRSSISKLSVGAGSTRINNRPVTTGPLARLGALTAEFDRDRPRIVALGYPRDWLHALALDLSTRVGAVTALGVPPKVELVDPGQDTLNEAIVEKPPDSRIKLEPVANGFALVIPPAGIWKGSRGLIGFGIVWCLFMGVFTWIIAAGKLKGDSGTTWPLYLFIAGFWAIGLGLLASAFNMGLRRARLVVANDRLQGAQKSLFGVKQWGWSREELAAIRADASGMEVNDRPIIELQIHPVAGRKVGLFAGRDEEELRWIAAELRRGLRVPAIADAKT